MSAITSGPTGAGGQANAATNGADAKQNTMNDFTQAIAELLGGAIAVTAPAVATPTPATTDASTQAGDEDPSAKHDPLNDMLGLSPPFAYVAPPPQAPINTSPVTTESNEAIDSLAASNGTGGGDALRLRQLSKLLAKSSPANEGDDTAQPPGGAPFTALLGPADATQPAADQSVELAAKLRTNDDVAPVKPGITAHATFDQLQQTNALQARAQDAPNDARPQFTLHSRVGSHEWASELGNKLTLMTTQHIQSASLQLSPENLGPVEVKIEVNQGQTSVWFTAEQADTRTALEQSLPKLRELFTAQGMSLTDAGVFGQRPHQQPTAFSGDARHTGSHGEELTSETAPQRSLNLGLLDTYA